MEMDVSLCFHPPVPKWSWAVTIYRSPLLSFMFLLLHLIPLASFHGYFWGIMDIRGWMGHWKLSILDLGEITKEFCELCSQKNIIFLLLCTWEEALATASQEFPLSGAIVLLSSDLPLFTPQKWELRESYPCVFYSIRFTLTELKLNSRKVLILIILCL